MYWVKVKRSLTINSIADKQNAWSHKIPFVRITKKYRLNIWRQVKNTLFLQKNTIIPIYFLFFSENKVLRKPKISSEEDKGLPPADTFIGIIRLQSKLSSKSSPCPRGESQRPPKRKRLARLEGMSSRESPKKKTLCKIINHKNKEENTDFFTLKHEKTDCSMFPKCKSRMLVQRKFKPK